MGQYRRLSLMEREELSRILAAGYSLRATAQAMMRAPSTLSRELTRHRVLRSARRSTFPATPQPLSRHTLRRGSTQLVHLLPSDRSSEVVMQPGLTPTRTGNEALQKNCSHGQIEQPT